MTECAQCRFLQGAVFAGERLFFEKSYMVCLHSVSYHYQQSIYSMVKGLQTLRQMVQTARQRFNPSLIALEFTRTTEEFSGSHHWSWRNPPDRTIGGILQVAPLEDSSGFIRLVRTWRFLAMVRLFRRFQSRLFLKNFILCLSSDLKSWQPWSQGALVCVYINKIITNWSDFPEFLSSHFLITIMSHTKNSRYILQPLTTNHGVTN